MKTKFYIVAVALAMLCQGASCSKKDPVATKPDPEPEQPTDPNPPLPAADTEDWIYRKNKETGKDEKFFGIGTWHVPGYTLTQGAEPAGSANAAVFRKQTTGFNMVNIDPRYIQSYMSEKMLMVNNFSPALHGYLDGVTDLPKGADKDYYRTQYLKANANNAQLLSAIDNVVLSAKNTYPNFERVYHSIDEIALGGVSRWYIPSAVGEKMYESVKKQEGSNAIFFVDLAGHGRGSTLFFEQNYLKTHSVMPSNPPYDLLSENARKQTAIPLLGFTVAHDGTPVYQFDAAGNYNYNDIALGTLKTLWYENVKQLAAAYKNNGNVFAINAFRDFNFYPVLAGVTVDALKAGLGNKPVWLYFDGSGASKAASVTPASYALMVRCQIYTSIIHGATGMLFWNDWSKPVDVYNAMLPMIKVLSDDVSIFKLKTVERFVNGDLHWMMKQDDSGKRYIIMSNTSKTSKQQVNITGVSKKELGALEVYVAAI